MKVCSRCKWEKPSSEFSIKKHNKRGEPIYQASCRSCNQEYQHRHYLVNKDKYREKARERQREIKEFLRELKSSTPCADCGQKYHYAAMEFDHLPGSIKEGNIANDARSWSMERVRNEIAKCEIVCKNCHAMRTWHRLTEALADMPGPVV